VIVQIADVTTVSIHIYAMNVHAVMTAAGLGQELISFAESTVTILNHLQALINADITMKKMIFVVDRMMLMIFAIGAVTGYATVVIHVSSVMKIRVRAAKERKVPVMRK